MFEDVFDFFDEIRVINLDRRSDRWSRFARKLPADWPFAPPLRYAAFDGNSQLPPDNWRETAGAWGCYKSHLAVIEQAIETRVDSLLVLEDDAVFAPDFSREVRCFLRRLPEDWRLIYLGGQHIELHLGLPSRINEWVYRPYNANRMHAYAIRGRETLRELHTYLSNSDNWCSLHHVDHFMGEYQKQCKEGVYVPRRWLVAQDSGKSDIAPMEFGFRTFQGAENIVSPRISLPMVAVLGPYSGGTSAVAGTLHNLGVSMGRVFEFPDKTNEKGNFESQDLVNMCRRFFSEPWLTENFPPAKRVELLRIWADGHTNSFKGVCDIVGGKQPMMCMMGHELVDAWENPYFISVERELEEVVNSLVRRNWGWPIEACLLVSEQLISAREAFLSTTDCPVMRLSYRLLTTAPEIAIRSICEFLSIKPSEQKVRRAIDFVIPRS